ncbi:acyl-CoA dehydrogenase family protein [uncultured Dokdonia sp.]|uniref:acyl-CoA dehydrogenase family protein n=1 Tax=uncultured Dokdonia sp. TaxID=575653 RepID=UPI00262631E2|nr:acyl-CoA dehydrogenase family protein [uncultured Dokdonia sp.]
MDFSWTEEQLQFKNEVISFAETKLNDSHLANDHQLEFTRKNWQLCADFGLLSLSVPKQYGIHTKDIDILSAILAMEGLGYGCRDNGLPFAMNAQIWTVQLPIAHFGTEAQKETFLPKLTSGKWIACHALTEPEAGSDVFSMQTTATKVEGGYLLNGKKHLITLGPVCDIALVFAVTNPKVGKWGLSVFIVEKGTEGFETSPNKSKMGLRTVPIGDLTFTDCFVKEENRLGAEGAGWSITNHSLELDRCSVHASQIGAMERQLEASIAYVKQRKQFGQSVGQFQSVSNRIADMRLRLETSRLLLYKVAWLKSQGKSAMLESAMLKLQISESFVASSLDTIRNHGGYGYLTENEVERDLRDAVGGVIYAGTSDIQRNIIAKTIGL